MSGRYLCGEENETFRKWLEEKPARDKARETEMTFIKKRVEALEKDRKDFWDELFDKLKAEGVMPPEYRREETGMNINTEHKQLFIEKRESDDGDHPLKHILKHIFS